MVLVGSWWFLLVFGDSRCFLVILGVFGGFWWIWWYLVVQGRSLWFLVVLVAFSNSQLVLAVLNGSWWFLVVIDVFLCVFCGS